MNTVPLCAVGSPRCRDAAAASTGVDGAPPPGGTVTWVIPFWNAAATLQSCVESVLAQTHADFDVVLVDDGSTDGSDEVADSLAELDRRVRVVRQRRAGVAAALNAGVEAAASDWIARLDADDLAEPRRLELQLRWVLAHSESSRLVALGSDLLLIDEWGQPLGVRRYPSEPGAIRRLMQVRSPLAGPAALIHRASLLQVGGFDNAFAMVEDYHLWMRLVRIGELRNLPMPLTRYRLHANQFKSRSTVRQLRLTTRARHAAIPWRERSWRFYLRSLLEFLLGLLPSRAIRWLFVTSLLWGSRRARTSASGVAQESVADSRAG